MPHMSLGLWACAWARLARTNFDAKRVVAYLMHTVDLGVPPVRVLKGFANWGQANQDLCQQYIAGLGMWFQSASIRGAMKFINSLVPPPAPQLVSKDYFETLTWLEGRLQERGLEVPPRIEPAIDLAL